MIFHENCLLASANIFASSLDPDLRTNENIHQEVSLKLNSFLHWTALPNIMVTEISKEYYESADKLKPGYCVQPNFNDLNTFRIMKI